LITGLLGKRGMLEKQYFEDLDRTYLEKEEGYKIFMFHTALSELNSNEYMDSAPLSLLPKGFDYYAAGHVHERIESTQEEYGKIVYPGPLFPNSFKELEDLSYGGFYIVDDKAEFIPVKLKNTVSIRVKGETVEEIKEKILNTEADYTDAIVTIRIEGVLNTGKISDMDFRKLFNEIYDKGAYFVMKNTAGVSSKEFEDLKVAEENVEEIEEKLILEHLGKVDYLSKEQEKTFTKELLKAMSENKKEGETNRDFSERIIETIDNLVKTNST